MSAAASEAIFTRIAAWRAARGFARQQSTRLVTVSHARQHFGST